MAASGEGWPPQERDAHLRRGMAASGEGWLPQERDGRLRREGWPPQERDGRLGREMATLGKGWERDTCFSREMVASGWGGCLRRKVEASGEG